MTFAPAFRQTLSALGILTLLTHSSWAVAAENACTAEKPLMEATVSPLAPMPGAGAALGSWVLPISGDSPDVVTAAKAHVSVEKAAEGASPGWSLRVSFTFDDPEPWGLPFNFSYFRLEWEDSRGPQSAEFDWSGGCQNVGVTLFPGSSYSDTVPVSPEAAGMKNIRVRLWGNR